MIIDMLNELRRTMDEHSDKFNKELEYRKKNQTELKNMITEIKETRIINSRLDDRNRSVKWRSSENIQTEQKKKRERIFLKCRQFSRLLEQHQED